MRKVIYKENVLIKDDSGNGDAGRSRWVMQDKGEALFHQFGLDYEEFESSGCSFSVAILELADGQVITVPAHLIRFID